MVPSREFYCCICDICAMLLIIHQHFNVTAHLLHIMLDSLIFSTISYFMNCKITPTGLKSTTYPSNYLTVVD